MGPNMSENLEKLMKTSKKLAKTSKNFMTNFTKTFFTARYRVLIEIENISITHSGDVARLLLTWTTAAPMEKSGEQESYVEKVT